MWVPRRTCCTQYTTCALCRCGIESSGNRTERELSAVGRHVSSAVGPNMECAGTQCIVVPQGVWDTKFSDIRSRVASEWAALPKTADVISQPLGDKMAAVRAARGLQ